MSDFLEVHLLDAQGDPVEGVFLSLTVRMKKKSNYHCNSRCSDRSGRVLIAADHVASQCLDHLEAMPMDYVGLSDDTFESLRADVPPTEQVERAIRFFDKDGKFYKHYNGYRDDLVFCRDILLNRGPVRLADPPLDMTPDDLKCFGQEVTAQFQAASKFRFSKRQQ